MAIEELQSTLDTLIKVAPRERILLTRKGQPFAFVSDASTLDWEDIGYMTDPAFSKMIAERRKERGGIPLAEVEAEVVQREKAYKSSRSSKKLRAKRRRSAA